jgi:hypothetical protein
LCGRYPLRSPPPEPNWLPLKVGTVNHFVADVPTTVRISLKLAQKGAAIANASCTVVGLPEPNQFTTDGSGNLEFDAPIALEFVTLHIPSLSLERRLRIGHLDPAEEPSGIAQRLRNLGFLGSSRTTPGALADAVTAFQRANGLTATGEVDDATREKLSGAHGC